MINFELISLHNTGKIVIQSIILKVVNDMFQSYFVIIVLSFISVKINYIVKIYDSHKLEVYSF